jgi:preprotein translocase subunit SecG
MYKFLLVVHAIIAAAMVGVILMQRSEGGGLAGGGSPSGLMTARGAADFLTRATTILAGLFVLLSIGLAGLATFNRAPAELDTSLARQPVSAPAAPPSAVPLAGADTGGATQTPATAPVATKAPVAAQTKQVTSPSLAKPKQSPASAPVSQKAQTVTPPPVTVAPAAPASAPSDKPQ